MVGIRPPAESLGRRTDSQDLMDHAEDYPDEVTRTLTGQPWVKPGHDKKGTVAAHLLAGSFGT
jgi:hypothetical protein